MRKLFALTIVLMLSIVVFAGCERNGQAETAGPPQVACHWPASPQPSTRGHCYTDWLSQHYVTHYSVLLCGQSVKHQSQLPVSSLTCSACFSLYCWFCPPLSGGILSQRRWKLHLLDTKSITQSHNMCLKMHLFKCHRSYEHTLTSKIFSSRI